MMHLLVLVVEQSHKRFPVAADCESNMLDPVCLTPSPNKKKKNSLKCVFLWWVHHKTHFAK